jgi:hypothetical protein
MRRQYAAAPAEHWHVPAATPVAVRAEARWHEHAAAPHAPAGALLVQPVKRHALLRTLFWILSAVAFLVSLGAFVGLLFASSGDEEAHAALLSIVLVSLAWQPFLLWKALQRYRRPLWYGTLRPLLLTFAVLGCIALAMVAVFGDLHGDDWIPFLIVGAVLFVAGMIMIFIPGRPWRARDIRGTPAAPTPEMPASAPAAEAIVIDARGQQSASIGVALVTIALLLAGAAALFELRSSERIRYRGIEIQADPPRIAFAPRAPAEPLIERVPAAPRGASARVAPGPASGRDVPTVEALEPPDTESTSEIAGDLGRWPTGRLPMLVMTPLALGAALLLWSRRGQGWGPALRTAGGCGLLFALAATLLTGGALGAGETITSETLGPITFERSVRWGELAKIAGFAAGAATLLMWPRSVRGARAGF